MDADSNYTNQDPDLKPEDKAEHGLRLQERRDFIYGLRALADFYEKNTDVTSLPDRSLAVFPYGEQDSKEFAARVMRAMGSCEKKYSDNGIFYVIKNFGNIALRFVFDRDKVCERRVVGKRQVAEKVYEAQEARVVPAHEEDIVVWDCAPVLKTAEERDTDREARLYDPVNSMLNAQGKFNTNGM